MPKGRHPHFVERRHQFSPALFPLYVQWIVYTQDGVFPCVAGRQAYLENVERQGGPEALRQFLALEKELEPLQKVRACLGDVWKK